MPGVHPWHAAIVDCAYEKATGDKIEWRKFDSGASAIAALASKCDRHWICGIEPARAGVTRGAPIEAFLIAGLIGKAEGLRPQRLGRQRREGPRWQEGRNAVRFDLAL
jgi:taurine transport system substrate-binding protein